MSFIGKEILGRKTLKRKTVDVPEWEGQVIIRELTGREAEPISQGAAEIRKAVQDGKPDAKYAIRWQAQTIALGWINEDGNHVLEAGDINTLIDTTGHSTIELLSREIRILSGMQILDKDADAPVEQAKKNSTGIRNGASGSG